MANKSDGVRGGEGNHVGESIFSGIFLRGLKIRYEVQRG